MLRSAHEVLHVFESRVAVEPHALIIAALDPRPPLPAPDPRVRALVERARGGRP
jgi:hypothetical protein